MRATRPLRDRLYTRLAPCAEPGCSCCDCLLWTGCTDSRGYGWIRVNGRNQLIHRVAWELEHGPIPGRMTIDHVHDRGCRHKNCGRLAHLELVTARENIQRSYTSNPQHGRPVSLSAAHRLPRYGDLVQIDHGGAEFPYRQLAAHVRQRILSGEYAPGRKLPSIIELQSESGLSAKTVQRAIAVLEREGLVITVPNRGSFVVNR